MDFKKTSIIVIGIMIVLFVVFNASSSLDNEEADEYVGIVQETNNDEVIEAGVSKIGHQGLRVKLETGPYKDGVVESSNLLMGKLDYDTFYKRGDKVIIKLRIEDQQIVESKVLELVRTDWELVLFFVFIICLLIYARYTGIKALISFVATIMIIWKILIPGLLNGQQPLVLITVVIALLSAIILFLVTGFTKKGLSAFLGTIIGLLISVVITLFFGDKLQLIGATMPFSETLLFSGHLTLNLKHIFYGAIIIGASGAAMDIAVDIASAMDEIKLKKPDIGREELTKSGITIGRSVIGTMTTTLLLAYSGGYITLMMLFMTKETSLLRVFNMKMISAEIMKTLVGSIGLVLVAPITAYIAGFLLTLDDVKNDSISGKVDVEKKEQLVIEDAVKELA